MQIVIDIPKGYMELIDTYETGSIVDKTLEKARYL